MILTASSILRGCAGAIVYAALTWLGTVYHAGTTLVGSVVFPVGLLLAVAMMIAAGVAVRAGLGAAGLVGGAIAAFVVTQGMVAFAPGGDVIVAATVAGYVWLFAAPGSVLVATFLPRGWFTTRPNRNRR